MFFGRQFLSFGDKFSVPLSFPAMGYNQRLYNYIDARASVSIRLKQGNRWVQRHSLCLSADPPSSTVFWGAFCVIPEFLATDVSY